MNVLVLGEKQVCFIAAEYFALNTYNMAPIEQSSDDGAQSTPAFQSFGTRISRLP